MWGALKEHWKLNGRASLRKMKRKQFDPINHLLGPSWWWRMRKTKRGPLSFPAKPLFVISLMVDFGCRHGCLQATFKFWFTLKSPYKKDMNFLREGSCCQPCGRRLSLIMGGAPQTLFGGQVCSVRGPKTDFQRSESRAGSGFRGPRLDQREALGGGWDLCTMACVV